MRARQEKDEERKVKKKRRDKRCFVGRCESCFGEGENVYSSGGGGVGEEVTRSSVLRCESRGKRRQNRNSLSER